MASRSVAASARSLTPVRPDIMIANFWPTGRADAMPSFMAEYPSTPACVRIAAPRMASLPKIL